MITIEALGERIVIIGCSGAGKSTLARRLAQQLNLTHIELDQLHWGPDWTPKPREVFRQAVSEIVDSERWVADGNYHMVRDILWPRATTVLWLDYSLTVCFRRVLIRTISRSLKKERLWANNYETLTMGFLSSDSILLWVLRTHGSHRKQFPLEFEKPEYKHLTIHQMKRPHDTSDFIRGISSTIANRQQHHRHRPRDD